MVDQSMAFIIPVLKKGVKYGFNLNNKFYATCESPAENLWPWIRPAKGCELSFREFEVAISEEMRSSKPHRQCLRSTRVPIFSYGGSQYQAARAISKSLWLERTGDRRRDQLVGNLDFYTERCCEEQSTMLSISKLSLNWENFALHSALPHDPSSGSIGSLATHQFEPLSRFSIDNLRNLE